VIGEGGGGGEKEEGKRRQKWPWIYTSFSLCLHRLKALCRREELIKKTQTVTRRERERVEGIM